MTRSGEQKNHNDRFVKSQTSTRVLVHLLRFTPTPPYLVSSRQAGSRSDRQIDSRRFRSDRQTAVAADRQTDSSDRQTDSQQRQTGSSSDRQADSRSDRQAAGATDR